MNGEILTLFIILLLALVLCSFLGGSNCSGKEGFTSENINGVYTGPNGEKAVVTDNKIIYTINGTNFTLERKKSEMNFTSSNGYSATFTNDGKLVITDSNGNEIKTTNVSESGTTESGTTESGTTESGTSSSYDNYNHYDGSSYPTIYYGPNGGTARVINVDGQHKIVITNANGTTNIYYVDTKSTTVKKYIGPNGGTAVIVTDSNGKRIVKITLPSGKTLIYYSDNIYASKSQDPTINQSQGKNDGSSYDVNMYADNSQSTTTGPNGNSITGANNTYDSSAYYNSLPKGIPASQIPSGDEDLYILKSQVVPPVCPKCPYPIIGSSETFDNSKCPPCPPCARCPEPAFDCKKVPNYNSFNADFMPVPILSDFSTFGM